MPETFQPVQFGNYLLVSQLGRGGMAEVYKARQSGAAGFERVVCVKRILKQHCEDPHFLDMFVNEAKISARLSHPNIVHVTELGEIDGEFFMAMEFVHGRDLLRVIKQQAQVTAGPMPPAVCAYIARDMCRALAHAHDHKGDDGQNHPVIHRDVSPQNVMLSYEGIVKLVDFGIAKALHMAGAEETRTGALKGKFAYMAPEQLDGQKATPICDVFAVGVVLHEMLTGRRLFKGNTDFDTLVRVKTQVIAPPSSLNQAVPQDLDKIVATALQRDPQLRYQRAAYMARDLELFCAKAGFTAEEMKEYMTHLFPQREEIADGVVVASSSGSSQGGASRAGASRAAAGGASRAGTSSGSRAGTSAPTGLARPLPQAPAPAQAQTSPGGGAGKLAAFAVAGLLLVGGGGGAAYILTKKDAPAMADTGADPAKTTAAVAPATDPPKAGDIIVSLDSNPPGAEVTSGPRVLGTTPLEMRLTDKRPAMDIKLSKKGFDDLDYKLTTADAPTLTLKLAAKKRRSGGDDRTANATPEPAQPAAPRPPHVRSVDDIEAPKVKTIDD